jgi:hypothetical protein
MLMMIEVGRVKWEKGNGKWRLIIEGGNGGLALWGWVGS